MEAHNIFFAAVFARVGRFRIIIEEERATRIAHMRRSLDRGSFFRVSVRIFLQTYALHDRKISWAEGMSHRSKLGLLKSAENLPYNSPSVR